MLTIEQLMKDTYAVDSNGKVIQERRGRYQRVLDGLHPKRPPVVEGLHEFTPEELLALYVAQVQVNGRIVGYQRQLDETHARRIARWLLDNKPVPTLDVALEGDGRMFIVDGQHRAAGAVIARRSVQGVVRKLNKESQAELFFSQRKAKTIDPNTLVLAGTTPFDRYVQSAIYDRGNPWNGMVSASRNAKRKIGPYAMFQLIVRYVGNVEGQGTGRLIATDDNWNHALADELASLIRCFGDKESNPLAFRPVALNAIGSTAMWVFRRHPGTLADDHDRWVKQMPTFPFDRWLQLRTQRELVDVLLAHWNRRLTGSRKVIR